MFYVDIPIKYNEESYHGFCVPLMGAGCILKLLKSEDGCLSRSTIKRNLKHLLIGKIDSAAFELDFLNFLKKYHYHFSDEAIESFLSKFDEFVKQNPIRGKKYLPAFQLDPERLSLDYKESTILTTLILETEKELTSREDEIDYFDICDYETVYVDYLGMDDEDFHYYYPGHSMSSVLARRSDKGRSPRDLLLAFTKRPSSPPWEQVEGLEIRLQSLIAQARYEIKETKFRDLMSVRCCGKNGFSTRLTPAEIVTICLSEPKCYEDYDVVSIPRLRNLNKIYKKFTE
jgi:hypothetical protein